MPEEAREIIERLRQATADHTLAALARRLDIEPSVINRAIRDQRVPELWMYKVSYATGYRVEWLRTGRGAKLNPAHVSVAAESLGGYGLPPSALVPVLTWVQAGALRSAVDLYPYAGVAEEYITVSLRGEHCFALRVRGDSMLPEFREGDMIVVDPDLSPRSGDFVVAVVDATGEATFKRYQKKKDGEVLMPLNPDYVPIMLRPEHRLVGKVIRLVRSY
mgnify:CR=1 FL=1